jgi:hypothetical protein
VVKHSTTISDRLAERRASIRSIDAYIWMHGDSDYSLFALLSDGDMLDYADPALIWTTPTDEAGFVSEQINIYVGTDPTFVECN